MANVNEFPDNYFIIVHAGAGYHSPKKEVLYNKICYNACLQASQLFDEKSTTAMDAAVKAVQILEQSSVTNAGIGSNLTLDGTVECDASVMCSRRGIFGSVGALSGILNPVNVAHLLYKQQLSTPTLSLGRVPPMTLVGSGAYQWAVSRGVPICPPNSLVTNENYRYHMKCMQQIERLENRAKSEDAKLPKLDDTPDNRAPLDTVGAVCMDPMGDIAVAVSSGGIACKQSGRLGQASLYGYGCWAESREDVNIGLASTGTGEQLMQTRLVTKCADTLIESDDIFRDVYQSFNSDFLQSPQLTDCSFKNAGIIVLKVTDSARPIVDALYCHTTDSMSLALFSSQMEKPQCYVSRGKPKSDNPITIGGLSMKLKIDNDDDYSNI